MASRRTPEEPAKGIRFVLSEAAVRRLRNADRVLSELWSKYYHQVPAAIMNDIAEAHLATQEAVTEIGRCNVESAPAEEAA